MDEEDVLASDANADDIEEKECVVAYFRVDEASGQVLNDISDHKHQISFNGGKWSEESLEEGEPLEYEDKWGKTN